jgi:hypothetical protein
LIKTASSVEVPRIGTETLFEPGFDLLLLFDLGGTGEDSDGTKDSSSELAALSGKAKSGSGLDWNGSSRLVGVGLGLRERG